MTLINILILDMTLYWMQVYFFLLSDDSGIATDVIIFKVDNSFSVHGDDRKKTSSFLVKVQQTV